MARGFGAAERSSSLKAKGGAYGSINADRKTLYDYLESDHRRVLQWGLPKGELGRVAKVAGIVREQFPPDKNNRNGFDYEAVDEALKLSKLFDPSETPEIDEHIEFAKGFNALDKAIEAGDARGIGSSARELLKSLDKQNGAEYINDVDGGIVDDTYVIEILKGLRGIANASQGTMGDGDMKAIKEMRDTVIENFMERGEDDIARSTEMFESPFSNRFEKPFDALRTLLGKGVDVKKAFII